MPFDPGARERLLTEHLPEVRYIARRIHERLPIQVPIEDLVHAGIIGLIDAVDKFDSRREVQFKSYAKFRIRGAILDSLRDIDWGPRSLRKQGRLIEEAHRNLSTEKGRSPSEAELAERLGMDLLSFQKLLGKLQGLNLGQFPGHTNDDFPEDEPNTSQQRSNDEDPFQLCLKEELKSHLAEAMQVLGEQERQVLALYYFDELNMKEVGAVLGVGESRVSQIHSLALVRLRARLQELLQFRPAVGADAGKTSLTSLR